MEVNQELDNIPVVKEYPNVFPKDIPEFPSKREIEFTIELVLGTRPISIAPYRMSPLELTKLKRQIEELLEKGIHKTKCIPMGSSSFVGQKEGWGHALMCGL